MQFGGMAGMAGGELVSVLEFEASGLLSPAGGEELRDVMEPIGVFGEEGDLSGRCGVFDRRCDGGVHCVNELLEGGDVGGDVVEEVPDVLNGSVVGWRRRGVGRGAKKGWLCLEGSQR